MTTQKTIDCPQCGEPADMSRDNVYRPFCSRRCKLIDLGDWLDESNRIADPDGTAPTPMSGLDDDGTPH
ncbi:DNA gyrase inhibitor YacG [Salinisphaera sp. Q1T1-3]|uniref:DNA gyrase inhibitor YacG n=1 Tax=Salinisphaera sp. Q1T1-3 TaxID=2321229 RepID=UPI000E7216DE|nr:DNA gyrase inhibitor YacG [Salinisphaera sp. Q1T1-3]RJS92272.1 DNA gyrase inhibitor YacG [Salinisphaera sp. Q1T1-3]